MEEVSRFPWTTSTFNPCAGCCKVTPGCHNCYAERSLFPRLHGIKWGRDGKRHVISEQFPADLRVLEYPSGTSVVNQ